LFEASYQDFVSRMDSLQA